MECHKTLKAFAKKKKNKLSPNKRHTLQLEYKPDQGIIFQTKYDTWWEHS